MPGKIRFLSLARVLEIHRESIATYGGDIGVRDIGLLETAVAQPQTSFAGHYLHEDIACMAAAYLFHLVKNHPFVDGNKRTGALAAFVFLYLNGIDLRISEEEFRDVTLNVAAGKLDKTGATAFFQKHVASIVE